MRADSPFGSDEAPRGTVRRTETQTATSRRELRDGQSVGIPGVRRRREHPSALPEGAGRCSPPVAASLTGMALL